MIKLKKTKKPIDPEIQDLFIDDNNLFKNDDITDEDKKFILDLTDRTDFTSDRKISNIAKDSRMVSVENET